MSIYRKLAASSRSQAVTRSRELGLLEGDELSLTQSAERRSPAHEAGWGDSERRHIGQTERFQEILRRLAMVDESVVEDKARLGFDPAGTSTLDPKTAALLHVGASAAIGSPAVCLEWSAARAMAAGATKDEIADTLLAIASVAGLGRIVSAPPEVATALGYEFTAALEAPDGP
jgi:alkylhydroperoxidase/carboxymuconolactone decarboxylase family protein YurZ